MIIFLMKIIIATTMTTTLNANHNDTNNYDNKGRNDSQHFS